MSEPGSRISDSVLESQQIPECNRLNEYCICGVEMTNFKWRLIGKMCSALLALATAQAHAADLTILTAGAFRQVVVAVVPGYERDTGNHVVVKNDTAGALIKRIEAGETFDLLIVPKPLMKQLATSHLVVDEGIPLASVGIGVAVKEGASKPDISTVAAFKATLLKANKIAYIDPGSGGSSGTYVANLLQRLGLSDALKNRIVRSRDPPDKRTTSGERRIYRGTTP
jgi:molybdate transport system substrate-binding protein